MKRVNGVKNGGRPRNASLCHKEILEFQESSCLPINKTVKRKPVNIQFGNTANYCN